MRQYRQNTGAAGRPAEVRNVIGAFFSPTDSSGKLVETVSTGAAEFLSCPLDLWDFTLPGGRRRGRTFHEDDLLVIGVPTYAGRVPNKIMPFIRDEIRGSGGPALALVTYGGRAFDDSLAELSMLLDDGGFTVAGAAAFPAQHAFTDKLQPGRPDENDLSLAYAFGAAAGGRISENPGSAVDLSLIPGSIPPGPYYVPKGIDGRPAGFLKAKPVTDPSLCDRCGICADVCPMGSVDRANPLETSGVCIKCQACIRRCPAGARSMMDPAFLSHVAMLENTFSRRKCAPVFVPSLEGTGPGDVRRGSL